MTADTNEEMKTADEQFSNIQDTYFFKMDILNNTTMFFVIMFKNKSNLLFYIRNMLLLWNVNIFLS